MSDPIPFGRRKPAPPRYPTPPPRQGMGEATTRMFVGQRFTVITRTGGEVAMAGLKLPDTFWQDNFPAAPRIPAQ